MLYKRIVRSHLECAAAVWSPYTNKQIEQLEKGQKRATKTCHLQDLKCENSAKIAKVEI